MGVEGRTCFVNPDAGPRVRWLQKAQAIHREQERAELCPSAEDTVGTRGPVHPVSKQCFRPSPTILSSCRGRCVVDFRELFTVINGATWNTSQTKSQPGPGRVCVAPLQGLSEVRTWVSGRRLLCVCSGSDGPLGVIPGHLEYSSKVLDCLTLL